MGRERPGDIDGSGDEGMSDDFVMVDHKMVKELTRTFKQAPREIRGPVRKRARKQASKAVRDMKASNFSGPTGANTIRSRTKRERAIPTQVRGVSGWKKSQNKGKSYNKVKNSLKVKGVKFGKRGSFGGYIAVGFVGALGEKELAHFVAFFHEFGTKHMKARAPFKHAWGAAKGGPDLIKAVEQGIDDWQKKVWK